mmetsp:Transcript_21051/g.63347  ORF Transcript_21051/g.63347 Transcript_21051/m.63347 type:complete len:298 (-) Transcript_21051:378-1271(-)
MTRHAWAAMGRSMEYFGSCWPRSRCMRLPTMPALFNRSTPVIAARARLAARPAFRAASLRSGLTGGRAARSCTTASAAPRTCGSSLSDAARTAAPLPRTAACAASKLAAVLRTPAVRSDPSSDSSSMASVTSMPPSRIAAAVSGNSSAATRASSARAVAVFRHANMVGTAKNTSTAKALAKMHDPMPTSNPPTPATTTGPAVGDEGCTAAAAVAAAAAGPAASRQPTHAQHVAAGSNLFSRASAGCLDGTGACNGASVTGELTTPSAADHRWLSSSPEMLADNARVDGSRLVCMVCV